MSKKDYIIVVTIITLLLCIKVNVVKSVLFGFVVYFFGKKCFVKDEKFNGFGDEEIENKTLNDYDENYKIIKSDNKINNEISKKDKESDNLNIEGDDKKEKQYIQSDNKKEYEIPPIELLEKVDKIIVDNKNVERINNFLTIFKIKAKFVEYKNTPVSEVFVLELAEGESVRKIEKLKDDFMIYFNCKNIEFDKFSFGRQRVGICLLKENKLDIKIREFIDSQEFKDANKAIPIVLGKNIINENCIDDLKELKSILISGTVGTGKTSFLYNVLLSLIYKFNPEELKIILIDTCLVNFQEFNKIPHLLMPVETSINRATGIMHWIKNEIYNRAELIDNLNVNNIEEYNNTSEEKLPSIVLVIDDFSDIVQRDNTNEIFNILNILLSIGDKLGIYILLSESINCINRISVELLNKMNTKILFRVNTARESIKIVEDKGAEELVEKGEFLIKRYGKIEKEKIHIPIISPRELENVLNFIKIENRNYIKIEDTKECEIENEEEDPLLDNAIQICLEIGQASTSFIQRRFKIGYARAGQIIDQMEAKGIISGYEGSQPRRCLISYSEWIKIKK